MAAAAHARTRSLEVDALREELSAQAAIATAMDAQFATLRKRADDAERLQRERRERAQTGEASEAQAQEVDRLRARVDELEAARTEDMRVASANAARAAAEAEEAAASAGARAAARERALEEGLAAEREAAARATQTVAEAAAQHGEREREMSARIAQLEADLEEARASASAAAESTGIDPESLMAALVARDEAVMAADAAEAARREDAARFESERGTLALRLAAVEATKRDLEQKRAGHPQAHGHAATAAARSGHAGAGTLPTAPQLQMQVHAATHASLQPQSQAAEQGRGGQQQARGPAAAGSLSRQHSSVGSTSGSPAGDLSGIAALEKVLMLTGSSNEGVDNNTSNEDKSGDGGPGACDGTAHSGPSDGAQGTPPGLSALQGELEAARAASAAAEAEGVSAREAASRAEAELGKLRDERDRAEGARAEAEARVADLMRELDASQGAHRADANALVDLEAVVSELTAERDAALRQCAQAGGTESPTAADGDHAGAAAPATMAELRAELEHATAERDQALAELQARVASEVGTGANGGADAPAAASEAAAIDALRSDLERSEAARERAHIAESALRLEVERLTEQSALASMEAAELRERLAESAGGVHGLTDQAGGEARVVAATERADALEAAAAASQSVIEKLLEENAQLTETINRLGRQVDDSFARATAQGAPAPAPPPAPLGQQQAAAAVLPDDYFEGEETEQPRVGFFGSILAYIAGADVAARR